MSGAFAFAEKAATPERGFMSDALQAPMSTLFDELSKKARSLHVEQRAQLAQELLESVERDSDPGVQAAWEDETASRIASTSEERPSSCRPKRSSLSRGASPIEARRDRLRPIRGDAGEPELAAGFLRGLRGRCTGSRR